MLEKIIEWSIKNKFLVIMLTVFAIGGGIYSLLSTPIDAIPDLSDVQVIVYTEYKGQSPRIVEDQVTYPLTTVAGFGARGEGGARVFVFRLLARLRHFQGRHRYLLGAQPRARISQLCAEAAARPGSCRRLARMPRAWAGFTNTP